MIKKTIKIQKRLDKYAKSFCEYLIWTNDYDFHWIADEIWWVFYVNDMFFSLEDIMLYSMFSPEDILDIYFSFEEHEWEKTNLKNFIKNVWLKKEKTTEQPEIKMSAKEKIKNSFVLFKDALWLPKVNFERRFILCLHTGEILYSEREWQFKCSSDKSTFIDQTEHYIRVGWEEWKDFIRLN